jgi:peptidoglycan/xylan/chitin deacetylase (PgdA/CDA1 family)
LLDGFSTEGISASGDRPWSDEPMKVPILTYHEITSAPTASFARYTVSRAQFARQMRWLSWRGYTTLTLDELLLCRSGQRTWPARPVVITIDDGYADAVRAALAVLPRFGFTAAVFLVTGAIGGRSRWDPGVDLPIVDWGGVRELRDAGFTCGSHTVTHPRLAGISLASCASELRDARRQLEDGLGAAVHHFSYPYGSVNGAVRELAAEAGYISACSVSIGLSTDGDDPLMLQRVRVEGADTFADFVCRLRTARPLGETIRARLRRLAAGRPQSPVDPV